MSVRNLLERSLWTGVQSALALLTLEGISTFDATALETLAVAGVALGLSMLKTLAVERLAILQPIAPE